MNEDQGTPPAERGRSIEMTVDLEATPEQAWDAIATGNGIGAWFVPSEVEEREGGRITMRLGPGLDAPAEITTWRPPELLAYREDMGESESGRPQVLLSEFHIETRPGGCRLRFVSSGELEGDEWEGFFEGMEGGWGSFFANLQTYLADHAGEKSSSVMVDATPVPGVADSMKRLLTAAGLDAAVGGDEVRFEVDGAPALHGTVLRSDEGEIAIHFKGETPGLVDLSAFDWDDGTHARFHLRIYGADGGRVAASGMAGWRDWFEATFPEAKITDV